MKPHYPILDGLRGTAAILVVVFHLLEAVYPDYALHPLHHAYLAVDFFFMLSGFVVSYAYDQRWNGMTITRFLKIRLIRLHPLVILAVFIGALCFWFDPFKNTTQQQISIFKLMGITLLAFTVLPTPDVSGWGETHSLDGPCWSLLQEYIANILYALFGRKLSMTALWAIVITSGIALAGVAHWNGYLGTGWSYKTFWIAFIRMLFPFFAGLLLSRLGNMLRIGNAYLFCSLTLLVLFCLPYFKYNGLYEAACIIIAFPIIIAAGAGGKLTGRWVRLCKFSGEISYPIYILHYPFIYIYTFWLEAKKPAPGQLIWVCCGLFLFFIALSYAALKLYDEPVRAWFKKVLA